MTMCRILPGANQVNMAVFVGTKMTGVPGAARRVARAVPCMPLVVRAA